MKRRELSVWLEFGGWGITNGVTSQVMKKENHECDGEIDFNHEGGLIF